MGRRGICSTELPDMTPGEMIATVLPFIHDFAVVEVIGWHRCEAVIYTLLPVIEQFPPARPDHMHGGAGLVLFVMRQGIWQVAVLVADVPQAAAFTVIGIRSY